VRLLFILAVGSLPLLLVIGGSVWLANGSASNAVFAATWLLIPAIPACAVAALIAHITVRIHDRTSGSAQQKLGRSAAFFALSVVVLFLLGAIVRGAQVSRTENVAHERERVLQFLREQPALQEELLAGAKLDIVVGTDPASTAPLVTYEIGIYGNQRRYAIVEVDRSMKPSTLRVLCYTPIYFGHRDVRKPACAQ